MPPRTARRLRPPPASSTSDVASLPPDVGGPPTQCEAGGANCTVPPRATARVGCPDRRGRSARCGAGGDGGGDEVEQSRTAIVAAAGDRQAPGGEVRDRPAGAPRRPG